MTISGSYKQFKAISVLAMILLQLILITAKADFDLPMNWRLVFIPFYALCMTLMMFYVSRFNRRRWFEDSAVTDALIGNTMADITLFLLGALEAFLVADYLDGKQH
jgi:O-antigen/teichoic acid export membrane protein